MSLFAPIQLPVGPRAHALSHVSDRFHPHQNFWLCFRDRSFTATFTKESHPLHFEIFARCPILKTLKPFLAVLKSQPPTSCVMQGDRTPWIASHSCYCRVDALALSKFSISSNINFKTWAIFKLHPPKTSPTLKDQWGWWRCVECSGRLTRELHSSD